MAMIDGIKIMNLKTGENDLKNNPLLTIPLSNVSDQGEVLNKSQIAQFRGLIIEFKPGNIKLKGSLHKYKNNGLHNYDDFYFDQLVTVINDLYLKFGVEIAKSLLNNVEFGVNIQIPCNPNELINSLIHHDKVPFEKMAITGEGEGKECKHDNYIIKIYNKTLQYGLTENILRVEIKATKKQYFKHNNIAVTTLSDLLNRAIYEPMGCILLNTFNEIVVFDQHADISNLNEKQKSIVLKGSNPLYWKAQEGKKSDAERKAIYREQKEFNSIIEAIGAAGLKKEIANLIEAKSKQLLNTENVPLSPEFYTVSKPEICPTFTGNNESENLEDCPTFTDIAETEKTTKCPTFIFKIKCENGTLSNHGVKAKPKNSNENKSKTGKAKKKKKGKGKKFHPVKTTRQKPANENLEICEGDTVSYNSDVKICPVTKLDISMQDSQTKYLSAKGVKWYYENNPEIYDKLKKRIARSKYSEASLEIQFEEIAHNIRNKDKNPNNNPRNNAKKAIVKVLNHPALFNNIELISPEKRRIAGL